ncbi:hypothetical protein ACFSTC_37060 [Nonomuraea ferruginea]
MDSRCGGAPPRSGASGVRVIRTATVPSTPAMSTIRTSETINMTVVTLLALGGPGSAALGGSSALSIVDVPILTTGCGELIEDRSVPGNQPNISRVRVQKPGMEKELRQPRARPGKGVSS